MTDEDLINNVLEFFSGLQGMVNGLIIAAILISTLVLFYRLGKRVINVS